MTEFQLKKEFVARYGGDISTVRIFSASGRVNLIGEHIDYCGGKVLPAAIGLRCMVAVRKNCENVIRLQATTIDKKVTLDINKLNDYRNLEWGEYQAGVAYEMQNDGFTIVGLDLLYDCDVPFGSGLSSSAAIEVATAKTIDTFSAESGGKSVDNATLAVISQRAENDYAGVNCGIMDQYASACGKAGMAMLLDCATLNCEYVPLNLGDCSLVVINSNKKRSLQESKYNERRQECEQALSKLAERIKGINCLADVSVKDFYDNSFVLSGKVLQRAKHVIEECDRVTKACDALKSGDMIKFGEYLNQSHYSLRDLYEVTGVELDALTQISRSHKGCYGSRMTGAGFGGCTVSVVKNSEVQDFIKEVKNKYFDETGYVADCYVVLAEDGAKEIS